MLFGSQGGCSEEWGLEDSDNCSSVGPGAGTFAQCFLLAGGQWKVAERPCPSLEAQALEGGPTLEAVEIVWAWLLGT